MVIDALEHPELVFALAGPIGIDMDGLGAELAAALDSVGYSSEIVRLTELTSRSSIGVSPPPAKSASFFDVMMWKMECANTIRREKNDPAYLARLAMLEIRERRQHETGDSRVVRARHAYIVRQLKLPAEVDLFRRVYGKQFFLVSGYAGPERRLSLLETSIRRNASTRTAKSRITSDALRLAERDQGEEFDYGQQLRDTFHLADVFVEGIERPTMRDHVRRFIDALFGRNDISPTKDEYGMYAAKSASLRSADLSRQVGAAIFSSDGELITQGCNEVPKAGGGTYWANEEPDNRDVKGFDPNEAVKRELLRDLSERLRERSLLPDTLSSLGGDDAVVEALLAPDGPLRGAVVMDLTEFGRVVHAEMSAICDAARTGRAVKGAKLYCTTFPCHNCTKHILAAGIDRVIFMEPYPKSRAEQLHDDEITVGRMEHSGTRVSFVPFMGIAPTRYRDLFEKGRRKNKRGEAQEWEAETPKPRVDIVYPGHPEAELWAVHTLIGSAEAEGDP